MLLGVVTRCKVTPLVFVPQSFRYLRSLLQCRTAMVAAATEMVTSANMRSPPAPLLPSSPDAASGHVAAAVAPAGTSATAATTTTAVS